MNKDAKSTQLIPATDQSSYVSLHPAEALSLFLRYAEGDHQLRPVEGFELVYGLSGEGLGKHCNCCSASSTRAMSEAGGFSDWTLSGRRSPARYFWSLVWSHLLVLEEKSELRRKSLGLQSVPAMHRHGHRISNAIVHRFRTCDWYAEVRSSRQLLHD